MFARSILASLSLTSALCAGTAPIAPAPTPAPAAHHHHADLIPQGLMFAHTHDAGQLMFGYRYFWTHYSGMLQGSDSISAAEVFDTRAVPGQHYTAAMRSMDMGMHMLDVMWSPTDWATLMVMPQYMTMSMTMEHGGHGDAHGAGHSDGPAHGGHAAEKGIHTHDTEGWGDTRLMGMFTFWRQDHHKAFLNLGLSVPSGSVEEKVGQQFTHYHMQLGSGTWDLLPGLTYTGHSERLSWGAQSLATVRLEDANTSGYQLGNAITTTAWLAARVTDSLSISGRIAYNHEGDIAGHFHGAHGHSAPVDLQRNYGGHSVDLALGLNYFLGGALKGHRIGIEAIAPVYQHVNGIQLDRQVTLAVGWQASF